MSARHPQTTQHLLRSLRWRLTGVFAAVALVAMALLCLALVVIDTSFETRHLVSELRGQASRATALIYVENGTTRLDGIQDDVVTTWAYGLAVFEIQPTGRVKARYTSGRVEPGAVQSIAQASLADEAENGTVGEVTSLGESVQAVGMPWYQDEEIHGSVVVVRPPPRLQASRLLPPVALGGAALVGLLTLTVWFLAGRSLRPAGRALEDRERFLAGSAHELRAPLARLRAGAEAARRSTAPGDAAGQALRRLVTVADSAGRVVSNILLASRIDHAEVPLSRQQVRLDQVAGEIEHLHDDLIVDVREPVVVTGDAGLLRHAIANLVDNAVRHGRVGEDAPTVVVTVFHREGQPVVRVSDDGPGFPPGVDVLARYVTGGRGGTGLGLPLVRWIAERHGATMELGGGSQEDPGAWVELVFPLPPAGPPDGA